MRRARRGELIVASPAGYVKSEEQRLGEEIRIAGFKKGVMLVFRKFMELGSARQTLMWFLEHSLQVPVSAPCGRVIWRRPRYTTIYNILSNPVYAGAYAYGKTEHTTQYDHGQSRRRTRRKLDGSGVVGIDSRYLMRATLAGKSLKRSSI